MSLRDEIAYKIYMVDRSAKAAMPIEEFIAYKGTTYIQDCKDAADSILALPEMVEMREWYEKEKHLREFAESIGWPTKSTIEEIMEWKEKAKTYDQLPIDDEGSMYSQKNLDRLQKWKEKAEKWDAYSPRWDEMNECLHETASQLDLLMDSLMVREKCSFCEDGISRGSVIEGLDITCKYCHGTGYIIKKATPEEVREFLEACNELEWCHRTPLPFVLKSGATLFMKEKTTIWRRNETCT